MRAYEAFELSRVAMACSQVAALSLAGPELAMSVVAYFEAGGPLEHLRRALATAYDAELLRQEWEADRAAGYRSHQR